MRPRGNVVFSVLLLVLTISLFTYMTVSHAQSDQNGSAFNATPDNQSAGDNGTLVANDSSNQSVQGESASQQNGTASQTSAESPLGGPPGPIVLNTNCPVITLPGSYVLNISSIGAPNAVPIIFTYACVKIISNNVALDCANNTIQNTGIYPADGIFIQTSTNVTLTNCIISGPPAAPTTYQVGIYLYGSSNLIIANNTVANLTTNSPRGIELDNVTNSTISGNILSKCDIGIDFYIPNSANGNNYNTITGNNITGGTYYGIYGGGFSTTTNNNTIANNNIYGNYGGMFFGPGSGNSVYGNNVYNNSYDGIVLQGSNSSIYDNIVVNQSDHGIDFIGNKSSIYSNVVINDGNQGPYNTNNGITASSESYSDGLLYVQIYNNTVDGCAPNGILVSGTNASIYSNNVNNSFDMGIQVGVYNGPAPNVAVYNNSVSNTNNYSIYSYYSDNVSIYNNVVSNSLSGILSIGEYGYENATIDNNIAYNNTYGIYISTPNSAVYNNSATNNSYGIYVFAYAGNNVYVHDNNASDNAYGISIVSASGGTVCRNTVDNDTNSGIYLYAQTGESVYGNNISGDHYGIFAGYYLLFGNYNNLSGNNISNNQYGIYFAPSNNNYVSDSVIDNNTYGVYFTSVYWYPGSAYSANNTLSNLILDDNTYGIYLSSSSNNTMTNISIENSTYDSYLVSSSNNNTFSNISFGNSTYGALVSSSNSNTFANSSFDNSSGTCVSLASSNNNVICNDSFNYSFSGVHLYSSSNNALYNSSFYYTNSPIYVYYSSNHNALHDNSIDGILEGVYIDQSNQNSVYNNTIASMDYFPDIYLTSSNQNSVSNNSIVNNSGGGVDLESSNQNSIVDNDADNGYSGIILDSSNQNNVANNSADNYSGNYGISLYSSDQNAISGNSADYDYGGIYLQYSDQNNLSGNVADNSTWNGIMLYSSSQNALYNNSAMENNYFDLYVYPLSSSDCQNDIADTVGSASRPIYYSNGSVSWDSLDAAEIELCGADGSNVTNSVVNGSDTLYNDGFLEYYTDNSAINNTASSYNALGFGMLYDDNGVYSNDSAIANGYQGFYADALSASSLSNCTADDNAYHGFDMESSGPNSINGSSASGNPIGIYLYSAEGNNFSGFNASDNSVWAFSSYSGSTGNIVDNLTLGNDMVSFDSEDVNVQQSGPPQGYIGGSPSVEVDILSTEAINDKVTGISDGPSGSRDITSFGPTSNAYNGSIAYTPTPDAGATVASVPTDITPVSDISSPQTMYGDDALSSDITLPFNVTLFGRQNDHIAISTNGFVYLSNDIIASSDSSCCGQARMDSQTITQGSDFLVAGVWGDLVSDGVVSNITYGVAGTAPNRVYVISYDHNAEYDGVDTSGNDTFEIKLFENGSETSIATNAPDPSGLYDINRFVQSTSNSPDSFLFLNLSYTPADVASLNASTLFMARYDAAGWDVNSSDFSSPYGVDTSDGYVFANIIDFGSTFGILGGTPTTPQAPPPVYTPSSPPPVEIPLSLSLTRAPCPANQVTVTAYSGPGTKIRLLLTSPYEGLVDQQIAGSDGTATFQLSASGTYEADASQNGYLPGSETFTFTTCAIAPPPVPPPVTSSGCTSDDQCPLVDFCNLSIGACQPVTGVCGFAANHAWSSYRCCQDSDCPTANVCIAHACEPVDLTGDKEGLVGGQGKVHATVGGQAFVNATLEIILPGGPSFQTTTDANGDAVLPFAFHGNYTVNLLLAGSSVKSHIIAVALPPPAAQPPAPALVEQPPNYCWVLPLIIAMILAYLAYRKWRNGKNKRKPAQKA